MHRPCPFWPDDGRCVLRDCQVAECTEVRGAEVMCVCTCIDSVVCCVQEEVPSYLKGERVRL